MCVPLHPTFHALISRTLLNHLTSDCLSVGGEFKRQHHHDSVCFRGGVKSWMRGDLTLTARLEMWDTPRAMRYLSIDLISVLHAADVERWWVRGGGGEESKCGWEGGGRENGGESFFFFFFLIGF